MSDTVLPRELGRLRAGELLVNDGSAVSWREWRKWRKEMEGGVLVKRLEGPSIERELWIA